MGQVPLVGADSDVRRSVAALAGMDGARGQAEVSASFGVIVLTQGRTKSRGGSSRRS